MILGAAMLRTICVLSCAVISVLCISRAAAAGPLPPQSKICSAAPEPNQTTPVVRNKLLGFVIAQNPDAVARTFADLSHWEDIFKDENYCGRTLDFRSPSKWARAQA